MRILVVDDDEQLSSILKFTLRREGLDVLTARDGQEALDLWRAEQPDLVLLDMNLPKLNGQQVLHTIRAESKTPVIMLTVRSEEEDMVGALDLGADDYIAKPFSPRTLVARIRAVLRRASGGPVRDVHSGRLVLDLDRQELRRGDEASTRLTPLEFRLMQYLMLHRGQVLTSDQLVNHVWGYAETGDRMLLKQLVRRLRRKIEPDPAHPTLIETVPNVGYCFSEPAE